MKKITLIIIFLFSININCQTHLSYYFENSEKFDKTIPKPSEVIGHEVGEWHVTHDKLVQYMYALAIHQIGLLLKKQAKLMRIGPY